MPTVYPLDIVLLLQTFMHSLDIKRFPLLA